MKKLTQIIKLPAALLLLAAAFIGCEKDYTALDSNIQGIKNFEALTEKYPAIAYNKKTTPVQTDNFSSNILGVFNDPIYGQTTASIVTQLIPQSGGFNPDFGDNPEIVSVKLNVPFYSSVIDTNDDGESTYEVDSIFGNPASPFKLSVYRTDYFLADYDPNSEFSENQIFYSNANQTINFNNHELELLFQDETYIPYTEDTYLEESAGLNFDLNLIESSEGFWEAMFFDNQGNPVLSNPNNFKNFFRGLYFKAEAIGPNTGQAIMLNFSNRSAGITIEYTNDSTEEDETLEYKLAFTNVNRLNTFDNDPTNTIIEDAANNADMVNGDETLYLKGGEGSYAVVDLFGGDDTDGNGLSDNYEDFQAAFLDQNGQPTRLINEASISFYVNQNIVNGEEPNRVILYDLKNMTPVVDYFYDSGVSTINPHTSKSSFSKILERDENNQGVKYKINVTEHINNILLRDSTNVKLGLYVTTNINEINQAKLLNDENVISTATALSPRGTALYGSSSNVPEEKRVQLEINYTEPN